MATTCETRYASSPKTVKNYDTDQLREEFLIDNLMEEGKIHWTYSHYDRYMAGSAVPLKSLTLETIAPLKANYFLGRREIGSIKVTYYAGFAWKESKQYPTRASWEKYVQEFGLKLILH